MTDSLFYEDEIIPEFYKEYLKQMILIELMENPEKYKCKKCEEEKTA